MESITRFYREFWPRGGVVRCVKYKSIILLPGKSIQSKAGEGKDGLEITMQIANIMKD